MCIQKARQKQWFCNKQITRTQFP